MSDVDVTPDEAKRIKELFKDADFRDLFTQYMQEISDPKERDKQLEIMESQGSLPEGLHIISPKPGFVVRVKREDGSKIYVNICTSPLVEAPDMEGRGHSVPYCLLPKREENSTKKEGVVYTVYDCAVNPLALDIAKSNARFKQFLAETAIDGISQQGEKLRSGFVFPPNLHCVGAIRSATLRDQPEKSQPKKSQQAPIKPPFRLSHRGHFDVSDHVSTRVLQRPSRPAELVVTVELPSVNTASVLDMDIGEQSLKVCTVDGYNGQPILLEAPLPFPVEFNAVSARFDKGKRELEVVLKVVRTELPLVMEREEEEREEEEEKEEEEEEKEEEKEEEEGEEKVMEVEDREVDESFDAWKKAGDDTYDIQPNDDVWWIPDTPLDEEGTKVTCKHAIDPHIRLVCTI